MRSILLVTTLLFSALSFAQGPYSITETQIGTLVDDPAAAAVLDEHMPGFTSNPQLSMARGMTLVEIQSFYPSVLSEEKLDEINADLAALPAN